MNRKNILACFVLPLTLLACSNGTSRYMGQTQFVSAPPGGGSGRVGGEGLATPAAGATDTNSSAKTTTSTTRTVQETDLYRLEGDRLYYLNSYRGLMVFDVSNVDQPRLLGRSPIFGWPVDMVVSHGIATAIVADWYGALDDGTPFYGSLVRGLDATDPTNIKLLGEAKIDGWIDDTRVVGDVLYTVSEDYGWSYGWGYWAGGGANQEKVVVSSVSFAGGVIQAVGKREYPGYSGIFNVTPSSILLAHASGDPSGQSQAPAATELRYLDISDPAGAIVERGAITVPGVAQGWGADNGRWNLDFADGKTAHVVGCNGSTWGCDGTGYVLSIADFSNPDAPTLSSTLQIAGAGWTPTSRFDGTHLYLSPDGYAYGNGGTTPLQVYDLSNPAAPVLAGTTNLPGTVWNILPAPNQRLFALGNDWTNAQNGEDVTLNYLDVTNAAAPRLIGTSSFGSGWAWTPAAETFKAFTMDATKGLVVLPFSGWSDASYTYTDGLQLIEFTPTSERTAGVAKTRGWVERGIFVKSRLVSLSDLSLSVVDYTNHDAPLTTASLTLARNVVAAQPEGATITEVSSDWWDNDVTTSEVRVLPTANADELVDSPNAPSVNVDGVDAQVFRNGDLTYVVTDVRSPTDCQTGAPVPTAGNSTCWGSAAQVQVVDLSSGAAVLRGKVQLPLSSWNYGWYGWWGFYWYDWYDGAGVVQVGADALAFRRWQPVYDANGAYVDGNSALFVVDLSNADAPSLASVPITTDPYGWWGNIRVVGSTVYTTHYVWQTDPQTPTGNGLVRYYADRVDLSDRASPKVEASINVPGLIVGGSDTDPSLLYTIDYLWDGTTAKNEFDVVRVQGDVAELVSTTPFDGWIGNTFVRGTKVYFSAQSYDQTNGASSVALHVLDLSDATAPVDLASSRKDQWGWLLGVEGDRAVVTSGWGYEGVDIYKLVNGQPPVFDQFVRTRGWWGYQGLSRQANTLFITTGYWGVQPVALQ